MKGSGNLGWLWLGILAGVLVSISLAEAAPKSVLVVTITLEYRHASIPNAEKILSDLGARSGAFSVDYARVDPSAAEFKGAGGKPDPLKVDAACKKVLAEKMSLAALKHYDAVVFANTTGDLPLPDNQAFLDWIASGKGFVGMHSATDTFHGFKPYIHMIGAEFVNHGAQVAVEAINEDQDCPACSHLPAKWNVLDEIYTFEHFQRYRVHGLLRLDKHPDSNTPGDYPISWYRGYGKGRVFYTSLGHRADIWDANTPADYKRLNSKEVSDAYQQHILHGIKWALNLEQWDAKPRK